jgi:hypothetical protein
MISRQRRKTPIYALNPAQPYGKIANIERLFLKNVWGWGALGVFE